jgi:hypothetical protein
MVLTLPTFCNSFHSWRFGVDTNGHGTVEKELKWSSWSWCNHLLRKIWGVRLCGRSLFHHFLFGHNGGGLLDVVFHGVNRIKWCRESDLVLLTMVWVSVIRYQKCTFQEQKGGRDYDRKVKGGGRRVGSLGGLVCNVEITSISAYARQGGAAPSASHLPLACHSRCQRQCCRLGLGASTGELYSALLYYFWVSFLLGCPVGYQALSSNWSSSEANLKTQFWSHVIIKNDFLDLTLAVAKRNTGMSLSFHFQRKIVFTDGV